MNWYAKAIDIIEVNRTASEWREICVRIAKSNPSVLVNATNQKTDRLIDIVFKEAAEEHILERTELFEKVKEECKEILEGRQHNDPKMAAIRHCRNRTGLGLIESKEFVESL